MAINLNINNTNTSVDNIYKRYENQTPIDFVISNFTKLEDIYFFYTKNSISNYDDFYSINLFRIENYINPLNSNGYVAATKGEYSKLFTPGDFSNDFGEDFYI